MRLSTIVLGPAATASILLGTDLAANAGMAVPTAGELRLGQAVSGDTRDGVTIGAYRNQFWRLPPLRRLDRVTVRLLGARDHFLCAYGPDTERYGFGVNGSPCSLAGALVSRPATFVARQGAGAYLVGVAGLVEGPYRLRLERVRRHVRLRLSAPRRLAVGARVVVQVSGGEGELLDARAMRVVLGAEFADGSRRALDVATALSGRARLRVVPPADIPAYLYRDHPVTLRARLAPAADRIGAVSRPRSVRLG